MPADETPIATLTDGSHKAEIYSCELPGEFIVRFLDGSGQLLEETTMTGVSTYRQRESEILERLKAFASPGGPQAPPNLADAGEY